nr:J domain-containing protein [Myxacorys almedinensis]
MLGLHPSASVRDIRQTYRELSKLYHPDTTALPSAIATEKFQRINEAYATLSNLERRTAYDQKIGYSRTIVSQPLPTLNKPQSSSSAYLDPTDRPLSAGELFALFILGLTFLACLVLAVTIGLTRGEEAFKPIIAHDPVIQEVLNEMQTADAIAVERNLEGTEAPLLAPVSQSTKGLDKALEPSPHVKSSGETVDMGAENTLQATPKIVPPEPQAVAESNAEPSAIIEADSLSRQP